jgi:hypothetical protein
VDIQIKKGIKIAVLDKPIDLYLDELLQMQEHGKTALDVEIVTLNVNLLIHLLNTNFLKKQKK